MDNQHKQIKGYRDLTQEEIDLMNEIKSLAEQVGNLVDKLEAKTDKEYFYDDLNEGNFSEACKWVASGKTDLQVGFMKLIRAVAKPTTF